MQKFTIVFRKIRCRLFENFRLSSCYKLPRGFYNTNVNFRHLCGRQGSRLSHKLLFVFLWLVNSFYSNSFLFFFFHLTIDFYVSYTCYMNKKYLSLTSSYSLKKITSNIGLNTRKDPDFEIFVPKILIHTFVSNKKTGKKR